MSDKKDSKSHKEADYKGVGRLESALGEGGKELIKGAAAYTALTTVGSIVVPKLAGNDFGSFKDGVVTAIGGQIMTLSAMIDPKSMLESINGLSDNKSKVAAVALVVAALIPPALAAKGVIDGWQKGDAAIKANEAQSTQNTKLSTQNAQLQQQVDTLSQVVAETQYQGTTTEVSRVAQV